MTETVLEEHSFESRLQTVLELTNTIIWETDLDTMDIEFFGPVERVTGYPASELQDPLAITSRTVHPKDQAHVAGSFEALLEGRSDKVDVEYRSHPDAGSVRWLRMQAFLQESYDIGSGDGDGGDSGGDDGDDGDDGDNNGDDGDEQQPKTLVGMSIEITSMKQQEARLEEFTSVVAHDLRNPLNVAMGRLEMAREESDNEHLHAVDAALDRIEQLIDDLLLLARTGTTVGEPDDVDLPALAVESWDQVATRDASLQVEVDRTIRADESRLQQLFENLFRNSIEHGGRDVTVTVGSLPDGFFVEDDGVGLPESYHDQVLEPDLAALDGTTGLGLQIVTQVADGHGWEVRATEGSTGGARFEFTNVETA